MWYDSIFAFAYPLFVSRPGGFITRRIGVSRAQVKEVVLSTFKQENHCEVQSFSGSTDEEWKSAKLGDVVSTFAENFGGDINCDSYCGESTAAGCSVGHVWRHCGPRN